MRAVEEHVEFLVRAEEQQLRDEVRAVGDPADGAIFRSEASVQDLEVLHDRGRAADLRLFAEPPL